MKKPILKNIRKLKNIKSVLGRLTVYALIIGVGFVFIYPLLIMISNSFKDVKDLVNPMVKWIPTSFYLGNYSKVIPVLKVQETLLTSLLIVTLFSASQTLSCAAIGYGFAKFDFPLKKLFFVLILAGFIIPAQVTMIPQFLSFKNYGLLGTIFPMLVPALLGQGLKSAIFILLFFQFFKMIPKALDEVSEIDGASRFKIFWGINLPLSSPVIVIVFIFSFVWYWNETYLTALFFGNSLTTLPLQLQRMASVYSSMYKTAGGMVKQGAQLNEGIRLAGTLLTILPLILLYAVFERKLVASIGRAGITGE